MSNCDILVEADYDKILEYHRKMDNIITMVCAGKKFQVPYGTVQVDEAGQIVGLQEKPELSYRVNTGLYLIEPRFLDMVCLVSSIKPVKCLTASLSFWYFLK